MAYLSDQATAHGPWPTVARKSQQAEKSKRITLQHLSGESWDQMAATFDGVCHEQLHTFATVRWPNVKCEPVVLLKDGEPVAGALMMVRTLPFGLGKIAISKWGPILKDHQADDASTIFADAVDALKNEYAVERKMMLSLLAAPSLPTFSSASNTLKVKGFRDGPQRFVAPWRYVVDLRQSDQELKDSFSQKWRYNLKKSLKSDLEFERATPSQFKEFETIYRQMITRKGFNDESAYDDTIDMLMDIKQDALSPEVFFVRKEGEIIAGALIFKAGETTEYLYGATNDQALKLRAGYFLQWHIIKWLRDNTSARWYDLGGTNGDKGLHQFKCGLAGRTGVIANIPPVANYAAHKWPEFIGSTAFALEKAIIQTRRAIEKLGVKDI